MHRLTVTRVLPYTPDQLLRLVGDVERYPEFVPWVASMRTWNAVQPAPGVRQVDAEAQVGFAVVREKFATRVRVDDAANQIDVDLLYGPFRTLHNRWRFSSQGSDTAVEFFIEYAFKSRLLEALLASNGQRAANRIMACFESRARALYDQPSGAQAALG